MGLKDIVSKAKQVHTIKIHGTDLRFSELGYDTEQVVKAAGREYARKVLPNITTEKAEEYATLFTFLEMFRKGGETVDDNEFLGMSSDYHQELIAGVTVFLNEKVHTEGRRLQEELKERLKAKKLDQ